MIARNLPLVSVVAAVLFSLTAPLQAATLFESGDAGDAPGTAQVTTGFGAVTFIRGSLPGIDDVDLFAIFIADPALFSATTVSPNSDIIDSQLFLFDSAGFGVAANGDTDLFGSGETNATIPVGSVTGAPGIYYLAISLFDDLPVSASGAIFPDLFLNSSSGEVVGPTGSGGADSIIGWSRDGFSEPFSNYEIILEGATVAREATLVPEPASVVLWSMGVIAGGLTLRRRRR